MFSDDRKYTIGSRKWYTVPLSIAVHAVGLGAVVVVPVLVTTILLPSPERLMTYVAASPIAAPSPPSMRVPNPIAVPHDIRLNGAPTVVPATLTSEPDVPLVTLGTRGPDGFMPTSLGGTTARVVAPPAPEPVPERVRVGGSILAPRRIKDVAPIYPATARAARMSGVVIVEAVIGKDGRIEDARVLRSVRLLDDAALDAVRQWRYTPTMLNGQAVDVILTVAVNFAIE